MDDLQGSEKPSFYYASGFYNVLLGSALYGFFNFFIRTNGLKAYWLIQLISYAYIWICQYFMLSKNLQIHYLLVVRSCKYKEIFNFNYYWCDNWNWVTFGMGFFAGFYQRVFTKKLGDLTWWFDNFLHKQLGLYTRWIRNKCLERFCEWKISWFSIVVIV